MKKKWLALLVLGAVLAVASTSFLVTHRSYCARDPDYSEWFQKEFKVTAEQAKAIDALEDSYAPVCHGHCRRIEKAEKTLRETAASKGRDSVEYREAREAWIRLCDECTSATRQQVEAISKLMTPEEGKRYLKLVLPKLRNAHAEATNDLK